MRSYNKHDTMVYDVLDNRLRASGIDPEHAVIYGSTPIAVQYEDFRAPHDLDLVLPFRQFIALFFKKGWQICFPKGRSWHELRAVHGDCEAFMWWKLGNVYVPYDKLFHESCRFGHIHCASIAWVKRYKRYLRREKDERDLAFLKLHRAM